MSFIAPPDVDRHARPTEDSTVATAGTTFPPASILLVLLRFALHLLAGLFDIPARTLDGVAPGQ
jgi:hypothetical protein